MSWSRSVVYVIGTGFFLIGGGFLIYLFLGEFDPPNSLTWEYWQTGANGKVVSSRSEVIRNLGLLAVGVIGFAFAAWRTWIAQRQQRTAEEGLITERFTQAVEQIGSDNLGVRIGAIHALWRIAEDSPERDYLPVLNIICAFAREPKIKLYSSTEPSDSNPETVAEHEPNADVVTIMRLLKDRSTRFKRIELNAIAEKAPRSLKIPWLKTDIRLPFYQRFLVVGKGIIDLTGANLSGIKLETIDLSHSILRGTNLKNAKLEGAIFSGADLEGADLSGAELSGCNMENVLLSNSVLDSASFWDANLTAAMMIDASCVESYFGYANLHHTILRNVDIRKADFENANFDRTEISGTKFNTYQRPKNLTPNQIENSWAFANDPPIGLSDLGLPDVLLIQTPGSNNDLG